jgi:hypothetical protein
MLGSRVHEGHESHWCPVVVLIPGSGYKNSIFKGLFVKKDFQKDQNKKITPRLCTHADTASARYLRFSATQTLSRRCRPANGGPNFTNTGLLWELHQGWKWTGPKDHQGPKQAGRTDCPITLLPGFSNLQNCYENSLFLVPFFNHNCTLWNLLMETRGVPPRYVQYKNHWIKNTQTISSHCNSIFLFSMVRQIEASK